MNSSFNPLPIAIAACLVAAGPVHAFNPQPEPPGRFAMVGMVAEQTARLNVVAIAPTGIERAGPCRVTLDFLDSDGNKLADSANLILHPGKADHYDLIGRQLPSPGNGRTQFLPVVQVFTGWGLNLPTGPACKGVAASLEIFDASGRTSVFIEDPNLYPPFGLRAFPQAADPVQAFVPQPIRPGRFAMVGMVAEQTARLNVVAIAPTGIERAGPCRVTLNFLDSEGNKLAESANLILHPGKADHHDLIGLLLPNPGRDGRTQFLPAVQVQPNLRTEPACKGVAATLEIFDATGRTSIFYEDSQIYLP